MMVRHCGVRSYFPRRRCSLHDEGLPRRFLVDPADPTSTATITGVVAQPKNGIRSSPGSRFKAIEQRVAEALDVTVPSALHHRANLWLGFRHDIARELLSDSVAQVDSAGVIKGLCERFFPCGWAREAKRKMTRFSADQVQLLIECFDEEPRLCDSEVKKRFDVVTLVMKKSQIIKAYMSRLARERVNKKQAEVLGITLLTGATVIGMQVNKPATPATESAAASGSGPSSIGTVIVMIPKHLSGSVDLFLVRFDTGGDDVEMTGDEVQTFLYKRGERVSVSEIDFTDDIAERDLLAIAAPEFVESGTTEDAKYWLCWADTPLGAGSKVERVPVTWLERHKEGLARQYKEGAADDVTGRGGQAGKGGVTRSSILSRVRAPAVVDRSDVVELSELEAKTVLCIVSGSAGKLAGFLSRSNPLPKTIKDKKVDELRADLKERGLDTKGKKAELGKHLRDGMIAEMGG